MKKDLETISEELSEAFQEEIVISLVQKFSMSEYLYKIECKSSRLEVRIITNATDFEIYRVEFKLNLTDKFEEYLDELMGQRLDKTNQDNFFQIIVDAMKS